MRRFFALTLGVLGCLLGACNDNDTDSASHAAESAGRASAAGKGSAAGSGGVADTGSVAPSIAGLTLRGDVEPVRRAEDAHDGTFIPPFDDCRDPLPGETGSGPNGQVCTHVAISGCTEPGKSFAAYASCDVVKTQRPFWPRPPAGESRADDPRLQDKSFTDELSWVSEQVQACGCVCCHDSQVNGGEAGQWDIRRGPIWLDSLADTGLALFVGLADSSVLGAYPADANFGFDRSATGLPTNDTARMKAFLQRELDRRGITQAQAAAVPPFGGPIYENKVRKPTVCKDEGHGIGADGEVIWSGGSTARYVYVLASGSDNPGVPPNLDLPEGLLWRLDVLANADALASGLKYGTTPAGSFQAFPEKTAAPALELGKTYQLTVLRDVGVPVANCSFVFGDTPMPPAAVSGAAGNPSTPPPPAADPGGECTLPGGDASGFGASCKTDGDCSCRANYCALMPGQSAGVCTVQGCKADATVCPGGYSCLDLSVFAPGLPAICTKE